MRLAIVAIALATSFIPAEASSQQTPPPGGQSLPMAQKPLFVPSASTRAMDQFHNEERLRRRAEAEEARRLPERRERAERLAALANSGRCDEAIQIARAESDFDMATRLTEACAPSN